MIRPTSARTSTILLSALALLLGGRELPLAAQQPGDPPTLRVRVVEAATGRPLEGALVLVSGWDPVPTPASGELRLPLPPVGTPVRATRIGFHPTETRTGSREDALVLALEPSPVMLSEVEVRSRALGAGRAFQPTSVVGAEHLAERMAASVAATIAFEPGVTARTNGPMASQPVIRGLAGDRVLVLEDGLRTGDIATTAADHAVTIEPATARHIEVIRGPGGLLFGSNTLGGVVNVVRDDVPRTRPAAVHWSASAYGESVNRGLSTAGRVGGALGGLAWQVDGAARTAGDTRTPGGPLPFTDVDGFEVGAGLSWIGGESGFVGAALREYRTFYGVPSSFGGVTLPGAHDGGVYVDVRRSSARVDGEWRPASGVVEAVSFGGNGVRFLQEEFELGGFVGTRFGQLATSGEVVVRLRGDRHRGAVGLSGQWRDLRAEGSFTGTRPAVHRTVAAFAVNELDLGRLTLLLGLRGDGIRISPLDRTETLLLRDIRPRAFHALTGAVGARWDVGRGWTASLQAARAFRPPSIEELFSAGPHLANYAYEVGDPRLSAETGSGVDALVEWQGSRGRVELVAYTMGVENFIAFGPQVDSATGLPLRDPRLRRYIVYRPRQVDAVLRGLEIRGSLLAGRRWGVEMAADFPRGRTVGGDPLPSMPPATGRLGLRYLAGPLSLAASMEGRLAQRSIPPAPVDGGLTCRPVIRDGEAVALPAEFCATDGAVLVGLTMAYRMSPGPWGVPARITLSAENLLDTRWHDPLWRAKQVAPQPGRNLRLAVQVSP